MDIYLGLKDNIEIYLEKGTPDLELLKTEGRLETQLQDINTARDPNKKVVLIFDKNQNAGYKTKFFPERTDLNSCSRIEITINEIVYNRLKQEGYVTSINVNGISMSHRKQTKFIKRFKK